MLNGKPKPLFSSLTPQPRSNPIFLSCQAALPSGASNPSSLNRTDRFSTEMLPLYSVQASWHTPLYTRLQTPLIHEPFFERPRNDEEDFSLFDLIPMVGCSSRRSPSPSGDSRVNQATPSASSVNTPPTNQGPAFGPPNISNPYANLTTIYPGNPERGTIIVVHQGHKIDQSTFDRCPIPLKRLILVHLVEVQLHIRNFLNFNNAQHVYVETYMPGNDLSSQYTVAERNALATSLRNIGLTLNEPTLQRVLSDINLTALFFGAGGAWAYGIEHEASASLLHTENSQAYEAQVSYVRNSSFTGSYSQSIFERFSETRENRSLDTILARFNGQNRLIAYWVIGADHDITNNLREKNFSGQALLYSPPLENLRENYRRVSVECR